MICDQVRERLNAAMDGELAPAEAAELGRHLESCAECAGRSALLRQTRDAFRAAARRSRAPLVLVVAAAMLALGVFTGLGRPKRGPEAPSVRTVTGAAAIPADRIRLVHPNSAGAPDTIDCGLPAAVECVVDRPCDDGLCGPSPSDVLMPRL